MGRVLAGDMWLRLSYGLLRTNLADLRNDVPSNQPIRIVRKDDCNHFYVVLIGSASALLE